MDIEGSGRDLVWRIIAAFSQRRLIEAKKDSWESVFGPSFEEDTSL
jgi:hypothetical protein